VPELTLLTYVLITVATIWLGLRVYGRWINHITIYGIVWGTQIVLFQLRLIKYYDFSPETTFLIFGAWAVFVVSSLTFKTFYSGNVPATRERTHEGVGFLTPVLVTFTLVGAIGTYQHWLVLIRLFGSIKNVIISGNVLYTLRTRESGIPGMWPYVDSFGLAADFLGGYFAAARGRPILLAMIPIVVQIANAISGFGRSGLVIGLILWGTAYFVPQANKRTRDWKSLRKRFLLVTSVLLISALGMELIREYRGTNESFAGETGSLSKAKGVAFIAPSVYLYLSSDVAVLNKFLDYEFSGETENTPVGANTFAPFFRLFSKYGISDYVREYQKFYNVPVGTNTGTYLRELYADWGIGGTMLAVYVIGALCSVAATVYDRRRTLSSLVILSHLYAFVFFTFMVMLSRATYWLISLVASLIAAAIVDKFSVRTDT